MSKTNRPEIPWPSNEQVEIYLDKWDNLKNYHLQEDALDRLFFELCPQNTNILDILLKVSALNDFYSTNIFSAFQVAEHIYKLTICEKLAAGDLTLVDGIRRVTLKKKDGEDVERNFYSFATKYCSHHQPKLFPIYDYYVEKILVHFKQVDKGFRYTVVDEKNGKARNFKAEDLKDYKTFVGVIDAFRDRYMIDREKYGYKEIDKYIWQLGKDWYPRNYGKKA